MNRIATALALGSLLTLTVGSAARAADASNDTIRILCPTWSGYAPIFVADDLGYFKQLGIKVELKFDDDRSDVLAAMARKDIEMQLRTVGEYQGRPRDPSTPGVIIGTIDESLVGTASSPTATSSPSPISRARSSPPSRTFPAASCSSSSCTRKT